MHVRHVLGHIFFNDESLQYCAYLKQYRSVSLHVKLSKTLN